MYWVFLGSEYAFLLWLEGEIRNRAIRLGIYLCVDAVLAVVLG